jgi:hypothetical protein
MSENLKLHRRERDRNLTKANIALNVMILITNFIIIFVIVSLMKSIGVLK